MAPSTGERLRTNLVWQVVRQVLGAGKVKADAQRVTASTTALHLALFRPPGLSTSQTVHVEAEEGS